MFSFKPANSHKFSRQLLYFNKVINRQSSILQALSLENLVFPMNKVVSTSAFLVFFHAFSYRGVYFQWHSYCSPPRGITSYIEFHLEGFLTNYDVIRVERKTAEYTVINSSVQKRAQNREKPTSGDYFLCNRGNDLEAFLGFVLFGLGMQIDQTGAMDNSPRRRKYLRLGPTKN